jgi:hypothetical protein
MAKYPFTHNYSSGRSYYGGALSNQPTQEPAWSTRRAPDFYEGSHPASNLIKAGAIGTGLFAAGFLPTKDGRVWDYYAKGLRGMEEFSPAGMMRTFQISNIASQFETTSIKGFHVGSQQLNDNPILRDYYSKLIGQQPGQGNTANRLLKEGVTLKGGKLYWGKSDQVALKYASALRVPEGTGAHFGSAFARTIGTKTPDGVTSRKFRPIALHEFFGKEHPYGAVGKQADLYNPVTGTAKMPSQIIGGKNLPQYMSRQIGAFGTEQVSRFNRLLKAPFEMEPFASVFGTVQKSLKKLTGRQLQFAVAEGPGLKMFGRLAAKYGGAATAITLGYQTVDYMFRNASVLDNTLFGEGLTHGAATLGVKSNLLLSQGAELTGLHKYREGQEDIAPGSTSLGTLAAFPLIGALGAGFSSYGALVAGMVRHPGDAATARREVTSRMRSFEGKGLFSQLGRKLTDPKALYAQEDLFGRTLRRIATPKTFASREAGKFVTELNYKMLGRLGPTKIAATIGAGIGAALVLPFLPGAIVPSTRPDELQRIYSGEQEVAIRKGRWWEFGRSAYEGGRVMYHRPHWYARMSMRAGEKGIYGDEELSPLDKFIKKEFTYDLEQEHYYDRPYPVTALPFEDIPLVGPLLAHTIGRLIKPSRYMHEDEWRKGKAIKAMPSRFGERRATELGELAPGMPIDPGSLQSLIGEQAYRMTEMIGLTGFAMTSIKEALTGSPDLFDQTAQLESSRRMFGAERAYWDLEIGGGLGTTEALRRFFPHRRRQIPLYNPIRNTMPEWLPGPGERAEDFLHGDPFTKIQEGELRLPGKGYAARFTEVEGLSPEDYPLIHKYRILADIAPYTDRFKIMKKRVQALRATKEWNEYREEMYQTTEDHVKERKLRLDINEYKYLTPMGDIFGNREAYGPAESGSLLAEMNRITANKEAGDSQGIISKLFGGYWEMISHNAETAMDQMTPAAPAAKLIHQRSAIESYERTQLYGSANAFWNHPLRDFIRPSTQLAKAALGFDDVPKHIENRRNLEEYFDILKYTKNAKLANIARAAGDTEAYKEFEQNKDQTLFGLNPFTRNYSSIFRSLPRRDRDYFNAFADASSPEERTRILEMVPDNEKPLYAARWKLSYTDELRKAKKAGLLSERHIEEADSIVSQTFDEAKTEGLPTSKELFAEFLETRSQGENYGDWYRRTRLLANVVLPPSDWVGWHPSIDLDDVKLKVVENMGENMHDYDLWPSRVQNLTNKEYITEDIIDPIMNQERLTTEEIRGRINSLLLNNEMRPQITMATSYDKNHSSNVRVDIEHERDTESLIKDML